MTHQLLWNKPGNIPFTNFKFGILSNKVFVFSSDNAVNILASLAHPESSDDDESVITEEFKENSPKKAEPTDGKKLKSPVNRFAVKSKAPKDMFDLNAKKTVTDMKSR